MVVLWSVLLPVVAAIYRQVAGCLAFQAPRFVVQEQRPCFGKCRRSTAAFGALFASTTTTTTTNSPAQPSSSSLLEESVMEENNGDDDVDASVSSNNDLQLAVEAEAEQAVGALASTILAMLAGDEESAQSLAGGAAKKQKMIHNAFEAYDVCASGTLSREEAQALFTNLAFNIVTELAGEDSPTTTTTDDNDNNNNRKEEGVGKNEASNNNNNNVAKAHARRVLAKNEAGDTISRVANKLLMLADGDGDGRISLPELAKMFETVHQASNNNNNSNNNNKPTTTTTQDVFPQPLRALAGSLQLLPPTEGTSASEASSLTSQWHLGVPGDDHTLRQVTIDDGKLTLVGLGRSADASAYFLPELAIVLDAGIHVKSLQPKTVLLTHGHRDHIAALPTHAAGGAKICTPAPIASMVERFLLAEAQLNYGDPTQTNEETIAALGEFDIEPVYDGLEMLLPKASYSGSPTPLKIQVFTAPHKSGVPAVSYGIYRVKNRLKEEYSLLPKNQLGQLLRNNVTITESYHEGVLFYTGDTTINLLRERWEDILPKYKSMIHEVTFLGMPSEDLDQSTQRKGHTHYAQLHPWVCAFPDTTFICVHWSLRYSKQDVLDFFEKQYGGVPKNVVLWI